MICHLFCHSESCFSFSPFHLASTVAAAWRMFSSVKAFEGQQYSALKKQCLQSGTLFEDPFFPAVDDSLFYQGNRIGRVHWKRPGVSHLHEFLTSAVCTGFSGGKRISSSLNNFTYSCWYWSLLCCLNSDLVYTAGELCSIYFHPMVSSPKGRGLWKSVWEMVVCYMKHLIHAHFFRSCYKVHYSSNQNVWPFVMGLKGGMGGLWKAPIKHQGFMRKSLCLQLMYFRKYATIFTKVIAFVVTSAGPMS